jgi:hypothetical protein
MAEKLEMYFAFAKARGGVPLKVKLAMKSTITSASAPSLPDSIENLRRVYEALVELLPGEDIPTY